MGAGFFLRVPVTGSYNYDRILQKDVTILRETTMFTHLLVPLDGSKFGEKALEYALSLAQNYGSKITLLHIVHDQWEGEMRAESPQLNELTQQKDANHSYIYLNAKEKELQEQGYHVDAIIKSGEAVDKVILTMAKNEDVDTIVMSSHGFTGVKRLMFGNVAEKVVSKASVPVLLIRRPTGD